MLLNERPVYAGLSRVRVKEYCRLIQPSVYMMSAHSITTDGYWGAIIVVIESAMEYTKFSVFSFQFLERIRGTIVFTLKTHLPAEALSQAGNSKLKTIRGFTLIELLVVIAIIGILSSVVLVSLNTARAKGRDARRISDIKQIQLALELYYDAHSNYPLAAENTTLSSGNDNFISSVPKDPSTSAAYSYAALTSGDACASYHLGANLETTNSVLDSDADASAGSVCPSSGADFDGRYATCGSTVAATDGCFDVKP